MKVIDIIQEYLPIEQRAKLKKTARRYYSLYCIYVAHRLYDAQPEANLAVALVQVKGAVAMSKDARVLYSALRLYLKDFTFYKRLKKLRQVRS